MRPSPERRADGDGRPRSSAPRTVRRAVPGTPGEWVTVAGRISGLLLAVAAAERDGLVLPDALAGHTALRAWGRLRGPIAAAVRTPGPGGLATVTVDVADVEVLGLAARTLGLQRCRDLASRAGSPVAAILYDEALAHGVPAGTLVAELARVHGVLDVDEGSVSAAHVVRAVWRAGD